MSTSDLRIKQETTSDFQKVEKELFPSCNLTDSTEHSPETLSSRLENIWISHEKVPQINTEDNPKEIKRQQYFKESYKTYHPIKRNIFLDRKKRIPTEEDIFVCDCIKADPNVVHYLEIQNPHISYNCGDKCINRYMCTECEVESCPSGEYCRNRRFQLHQYAKVYPKPVKGKGYGLFAGEDIKKGDFVLQYIGEVFNVNSEEGQIRVETYSRSTCTYLMKITQNEVIDPTFRGNHARFINHSCDPNCITQKWNVLGEICVGVFAIKDIAEDAELSFDYQFDSFKTPFAKCLCNASSCKGYLGRKPQEYSLEEWEERLENLPCSICGQNVEDDDDKLLLCDSCHEGFHIFCLDPPLTSIPKGAWYCDKCTIKLEQEKNLKKDYNPLDMNLKLYEMVKKERSKLLELETVKKRKIASSDEEDTYEVSESVEAPDTHSLHEDIKVEEKKKRKFIDDDDESSLQHKKLEIEAMRESYRDLYPPSDDDEEAQIRIKKKVKKDSIQCKEEVMEVKEEDQDEKKMTLEQTEQQKEKQEGDKQEIVKEEFKEQREEKEPKEPRKDKRRPKVLRTHASMVNEFKEKSLAMFTEKVNEGVFWEKIQEIERKNSRGAWSLYSGSDYIDRRSKMINAIQLEVIKKNQIIFRRIGTRLFWEHHRGGRINMFKKYIEVTVMGYKEQLEVAELIFQILDDIAEEIERMRGQREALIRFPAMYLRKITGSYHNQQITDLENKFEISIYYSKEYLNDGCYPITTMTDLKIKGVKENLVAAYHHINYQIRKLKTKRLFCNRRDYTTLLRNLNNIKRRIHPAELRFNKTKEGALKELNHPFYYIQYKEKEVALIGTEKEIVEAERILEETFKEAHLGADEHEFGCVHYLWPTTNTNQQILQRFKADIEKEVPGIRFVYFEPIVPRKNMTLSIFGSFKEMSKAKELLKERVEGLRSTSLTLEAFQEHVKYQIIKYLFKCLHNFYITGNIADIKFWDLQSVEFEKIYRMTPLRQQTLQNIFLKDTTLQLYVLHICDFADSRVWDYFNLSSKSITDLLKKLLQSCINANSSLLAHINCEQIFFGKNKNQGYSNQRRYKQGTKPSGKSRFEKNWNRRSDRESRGREGSATNSQDNQRSDMSSRVSREEASSVDSSHSSGRNTERHEEKKDSPSLQSIMATKREEKPEDVANIEIASDKNKDQYYRPQESHGDKRESQEMQKPKTREEYSKYHERPHYQDYGSKRRIHSERSQERYRDRHENESKERRSDRYRDSQQGYYEKKEAAGINKEENESRSDSRDKGKSRSESRSKRARESRSSRSISRDSLNRETAKQEERRFNKPSEKRYGGYDRNPHYNKRFDAYLSQNDKEVGHYERMMLNKRRDIRETRAEQRSRSRSRSRSKSRSKWSRTPSRSRGKQESSKSRSRNRSRSRSRSHSRSRGHYGNRYRNWDGGRNRVNYRYGNKEHDRDRKGFYQNKEGYNRHGNYYDRRNNRDTRPKYNRYEKRSSPNRNMGDPGHQAKREEERKEIIQEGDVGVMNNNSLEMAGKESVEPMYAGRQINVQQGNEEGYNLNQVPRQIEEVKEDRRPPGRDQSFTMNSRRPEEDNTQRYKSERSEMPYKRRDDYSYDNQRNNDSRNRYESSSTGINRKKYYDDKEAWADRRNNNRFSSSIQDNNSSRQKHYSQQDPQARYRQYESRQGSDKYPRTYQTGNYRQYGKSNAAEGRNSFGPPSIVERVEKTDNDQLRRTREDITMFERREKFGSKTSEGQGAYSADGSRAMEKGNRI